MAGCGRLAGISLVCVGDSLAAGDYPPGVNWKSKLEELEKWYRDYNNVYNGSEDEEPLKVKLLDLADDYFSLAKEPSVHVHILYHMTTEQHWGFQKGYRRLPVANREDMDFLIGANYHDLYANSPEWILRNLATKEFVRQSVVAHETN
jgi:hypothetical protein